MKKVWLPLVVSGTLLFAAGCLSSASSFVASSAPVTQGRYSELAAEVSGTCTQVQWLFFTFGAAGSPQRHALSDAIGKIPGAEALTAMAVDEERFALISTDLLSIAILPVFTKTRVTGTPVKLNAQ